MVGEGCRCCVHGDYYGNGLTATGDLGVCERCKHGKRAHYGWQAIFAKWLQRYSSQQKSNHSKDKDLAIAKADKWAAKRTKRNTRR